jgi:hypothetical protein
VKGLARGFPMKGAESDEDEAPASSKPASKGGGGSEDAALDLAYEAMQEQDAAAFKAAMRSAIRACVRSYGSKTEE